MAAKKPSKSVKKTTAAKKPAPKASKAKKAAPAKTKVKAKASPAKKTTKPAAKAPAKAKTAKAKAKAAPKKAPRRAPVRAKASPAVPKARALPENPEALKLALEAAQAIDDKQGTDIIILDVRGKASYADYIVLASGDTERLVTALAEGIEERLKPQGHRPVSREGTDSGQWVLLDYSDVVVHLFHVDSRGFYDLEGLWSDAPRVSR